MIFSGDTYVSLPTKELYDTQMMLAAVNAAKDMYDNAKNDYDKFIDKYSDFVSPVYGAADEYNKLTQGRMQNVVNNLYAQGIDPLRSSQGRAALQNAIRTTDYGKLNALKQQAKDYEAYQNARREMVANGLTTDAFEDWNLRRLGLDKFTAMDGNNVRQWSRLTPSQLKSLSQITDDVYNKLVPTTSNGVTPDGKYDILSVSDSDRLQAKIAGLEAVRKDPAYEFYKEMAGGSDAVLADMIERTNAKYLQDRLEDNKKYAADLNLRNQRAIAKYSHDLSELAKDNAKQRQIDLWSNPNNPAVIKAKTAEVLARAKANKSNTGSQKPVYDVIKDTLRNAVAASLKIAPSILNMDEAEKSIYKNQSDILKRLQQENTTNDQLKQNKTASMSKIPKTQILRQFKFQLDPITINKLYGYQTIENSVAKANGLSGNELCVTSEMLNNLYDVNDRVSYLAGYSATNMNSTTDELRSSIKSASGNNNADKPGTVYGYARTNSNGYGLLTKDGRFHVYQGVSIYNKAGKLIKRCLLDTGVQSDARPGGQTLTENMLNKSGISVNRTQPLTLDYRRSSLYDLSGARVNKETYGSVYGIGSGASTTQDTQADETEELLLQYIMGNDPELLMEGDIDD